jgi:hypothetical protein
MKKHMLFETALKTGKTILDQKKYNTFKDDYVNQYGKGVIRDEIITGINPIAMSLAKRKPVTESLAAAISPLAMSAAKQAAVWGVGGALATKLTQGQKTKHMTPEEKRKARMNMFKSGVAGGIAGAAGTLV